MQEKGPPTPEFYARETAKILNHGELLAFVAR
jgi:hypothetical protein